MPFEWPAGVIDSDKKEELEDLVLLAISGHLYIISSIAIRSAIFLNDLRLL